MAMKHGTRQRYGAGCRCDECKDAQRLYQQRYRERKASGSGRLRSANVAPIPVASVITAQPGRVEVGVELELEGLAQAEARPGLRETALALARILDNPKAVSQQPAASKNLAEILDRLRKGADARKSRLASVRQMTRSTG